MAGLDSPFSRHPAERNIRIRQFIPGIAWFFLVLLLICLPGKNIPAVEDWLVNIHFDKWVHVGLFFMLAYFFMLPFRRSGLSPRQKWHYMIKISLAACLWGITTELIQKFFVPGRSFDLMDWSADSFGALLALGFSRIRFLKKT